MTIAGKIKLNLQLRKSFSYLFHEFRRMSTVVSEKANETPIESHEEQSDSTEKQFSPLDYRFKYTEFLPDPNPLHRNKIREKLERRDMLSRRWNIEIPEFYVGSIIAITHSDQHAPGKLNRFLGICISRTGQGLDASFILRNVIDKTGIEISYYLYDPTLQKIEVIRLEKRLDEELFYLRDAPQEYSTFPLDMKPKVHIQGTPIPVNELKIPLNPTPWLQRWERMDMKGIIDCKSMVNEKRRIQAKMHKKPWEKHDIMKMYRQTVPLEEQREIFSEVYSTLHDQDVQRLKSTRTRSIVRPKKTG